MQLSLILPCYNEEENVEKTVLDVIAWFKEDGIDGEVIAVDDGSSDRTAEVLRKLEKEHPQLKVVMHSKNLGYGSAVRSGLDAGTKEWLAYMDSDGQFRPTDFRKLLPHTDKFEIVTGRRLKRADPLVRKLNAKLFAMLNVIVLGIWVRDINCAMKIFKRSIWKTVRPEFSTGALFNAEVFYRAKQHSISWKQDFVNHYPRLHGKQTGANPFVILKMFRDLVQLRFSKKN